MSLYLLPSHAGPRGQVTNGSLVFLQMEEEGVPSTTLREVSLLKMLSESNHVVK